MMFNEELLMDWLHDEAISFKDKLLLLLAGDNYSEKTAVQLALHAQDLGWKAFEDSSSRSRLSSPHLCEGFLTKETGGFAIQIGVRWKLLTKGKTHVEQLVANLNGQPMAVTASTLRDVLGKINNSSVHSFVEESISNVEHDALRSAVVLSWCGAIALLRDHILNDQSLLYDFNMEAKKRNSKWKDAQVADDFGRMKEYDFLQALQAVCAEVSKDQKQQLENALKLRNSCGHPSNLVIDPHMVQAHVAMLAQNVFARFG